MLSKKIAKALYITNLSTLNIYEDTSKSNLLKVINSLKESEIIKEPLIVDRSYNLLIDGHHRRKALLSMGISFAPAINIDYMSDDVSSSQFYYFCDEKHLKDLCSLMESNLSEVGSINARADRASMIICSKSSQKAKEIFFDNSVKDTINIFNALTAKHNIRIIESNSYFPLSTPSDYFCIYFKPITSKTDVLKMAMSDSTFSSHINKHFFKEKIGDISFPLASLFKDVENIEKDLQKIICTNSFSKRTFEWQLHDLKLKEDYWYINK